MDEVETVADDDERKLIGELSFFKEVLNFLWVVEVALATDTFDFPDLACSRSSLDVLEMNLGVLAEVDDGAQIVVESYDRNEPLRTSLY